MTGFENEILVIDDNNVNMIALKGLATHKFNLEIDSAYDETEAQ